MSSKLFEGGVPTSLEVNELWDKVNAEVGESIALAEVERITGVIVKSNRMRTVLSAYRRRLRRERNLQTKVEGGILHFLTADAAQDEALGRTVRIGRATGRLVRDVGSIRPNDLTSEERKSQHRLLARETAAMLEAVRASSKRLIEPSVKK